MPDWFCPSIFAMILLFAIAKTTKMAVNAGKKPAKHKLADKERREKIRELRKLLGER